MVKNAVLTMEVLYEFNLVFYQVGLKIMMKRYGQVIGLRPEKIEEYKRLHAAVWPQIRKLISECNIKNYSIFLKDSTLFAYFEYHGSNFDEDMKKMAENEINKKWWEQCIPCQLPLETRAPGEWWANMEEVFHLD